MHTNLQYIVVDTLAGRAIPEMNFKVGRLVVAQRLARRPSGEAQRSATGLQLHAATLKKNKALAS